MNNAFNTIFINLLMLVNKKYSFSLFMLVLSNVNKHIFYFNALVNAEININ